MPEIFYTRLPRWLCISAAFSGACDCSPHCEMYVPSPRKTMWHRDSGTYSFSFDIDSRGTHGTVFPLIDPTLPDQRFITLAMIAAKADTIVRPTMYALFSKMSPFYGSSRVLHTTIVTDGGFSIPWNLLNLPEIVVPEGFSLHEQAESTARGLDSILRATIQLSQDMIQQVLDNQEYSCMHCGSSDSLGLSQLRRRIPGRGMVPAAVFLRTGLCLGCRSRLMPQDYRKYRHKLSVSGQPHKPQVDVPTHLYIMEQSATKYTYKYSPTVLPADAMSEV